MELLVQTDNEAVNKMLTKPEFQTSLARDLGANLGKYALNGGVTSAFTLKIVVDGQCLAEIPSDKVDSVLGQQQAQLTKQLEELKQRVTQKMKNPFRRR